MNLRLPLLQSLQSAHQRRIRRSSGATASPTGSRASDCTSYCRCYYYYYYYFYY